MLAGMLACRRQRALAAVLVAALSIVVAAVGTTDTASATNFPVGVSSDLVLGAPDHMTSARGTAGRSGMAATIGVSRTPGGAILLTDDLTNRVMVWSGMPGSDGADMSHAIGQQTAHDWRPGCSLSRMNQPLSVWSDGTRVLVADYANYRVLVYNSMPAANAAGGTDAVPDAILGQPDASTCTAPSAASASGMMPRGVWSDGTRIMVTDGRYHRVLAWDTWPAAGTGISSPSDPADWVIGQANLTSGLRNRDGSTTAKALGLELPTPVWSDGADRLLIGDTSNHRVLAWDFTAWPTTGNGQIDASGSLTTSPTVVFGQNDLVSNVANPPCTGSPTWKPTGVSAALVGGAWRIALSTTNQRVLLHDDWPTANNESADRVLGQPDLSSCNANRGSGTITSKGLNQPREVWTDGTDIIVADRVNARVLAWTGGWPATDATPTRVIGQTTGDSIGDYGFRGDDTHGEPFSARPGAGITWAANFPFINPDTGGLLVAAAYEHFVAYWRNGVNALASNGQASDWTFGNLYNATVANGISGTTSQQSMSGPTGGWTNGTRFATVDRLNNRVLLWDTHPAAFDQDPDRVIGQSTWAGSAADNGGRSKATLNQPLSVASDGTKVAVADFSNHRVLIWNSWPAAATGQAADVVLGQPTGATATANNTPLTGGTVSAQSLNGPSSVYIWNGKLAVADSTNHRVLIWDGIPTTDQEAADYVYGQPDFASGGTATSSVLSPRGVVIRDNTLFFTADCAVQYLDPMPSAANPIVASGAATLATGDGCGSVWTDPSATNVGDPRGLDAFQGSVWVGNNNHARVMRFRDTRAPAITAAPSASVVGTTSTHTWTTDESVTSEIHFGPTSDPTAPYSYGGTGSPSTDADGIGGLSHSRDVSLPSKESFFYRIKDTDWAGNVTWSSERAIAGISDNQAGETTYRNANTGTYDVDFTDVIGLQRFSVRVCSISGGCAVPLIDYTQVGSDFAAGTNSYTTNWPLPASVWSAMQEGDNYLSVRVENTSGSTATAVDAFVIKKDTQGGVPSSLADGTGTDIEYQASLTSLSANWPAAVDLSGVAKYQYCISATVDCGGTPLVGWTDNSPLAQTSFTGVDLSATPLVTGTKYFVAVRLVDNVGNVGSAVSSNGITPDPQAPSTPIMVAPPNGSYLASSPTLEATYVDPDPGSPGKVTFELCTSNASGDWAFSCGASYATAESATGLASGTNGTWAPTGLGAGTTYWWRVRGMDGAGSTSGWASARSFVINRAPTAPTGLVTDASVTTGTWVRTRRPGLVATFNDPDAGQTGSLGFEICPSNQPDPWDATSCGSGWPLSGTSSNLSIAIGSTGTWRPSTDLTEGSTYYWRAGGTDIGSVTGPWSATPWASFAVDSVAPAAPTSFKSTKKGNGNLEVSWTASTGDPAPGSGLLGYDGEYSTDGGFAWTAINSCTGTTATTCTQTGLGGATLVQFRVRSRDVAGNVSAWKTLVESINTQGYLMRSTQSTYVNNASVRVADLATATAANTTTRVSHANTTGHYVFTPMASNAAPTTAVNTLPPAAIHNQPSGMGWVVDDYAGGSKAVGAGPIAVTGEVTDSHSNPAGQLYCKAWLVSANTGRTAIDTAQPMTPLGTGWGANTDILTTSSVTDTCTMDGFTTTTDLGTNQVLYVELWLKVTTGRNTTYALLTLDNGASSIEAPVPGARPSTPTSLAVQAPSSPASLTPTLQAIYDHPSATNGLLEYEVATTSDFSTIVASGASTVSTTTPSTRTWTTPTLQANTPYWWRVRARDNYNRTSSTWSAAPSGTFTTGAPPDAPSPVAPVSTLTTTPLTPTLSATAFSDTQGTTMTASQWQVRTATGTWDSPAADETQSSTATSRTLATTLTDRQAYYWRVRYRSSLGMWSNWSLEGSFTARAVDITAPTSGTKAAVPVETDTTVAITGRGFQAGAAVELTPASDLSIVSVTFVSATQIDVVLRPSATATIGARDLAVRNPDGSWASSSGSIEITPASLGSVSVSTTSISIPDATPGVSAELGTAGSPAVKVSATATDAARLTITTDDWTGPTTMAVQSTLEWRHTTNTDWTFMPPAATPTTIEGTSPGQLAAGTHTFDYDFRFTPPATQSAGAYSTTVTYSLIPAV